MNTILNIKTNKELKAQAQSVAEEFGIPLTTVINSFLKQMVRTRKIVLDLDEPVNPLLIKEWEKMSKEARGGKNVSKVFTNAEDLFKHLKI